jgi:hypothetical protein
MPVHFTNRAVVLTNGGFDSINRFEGFPKTIGFSTIGD